MKQTRPVDERSGDILLTLDAYAELGVQATQQKFGFWLEIDRDTENADTLRGKCVRYWRAYQNWDGEVFPWIVFVVPDERRRRELERIVAEGRMKRRICFAFVSLKPSRGTGARRSWPGSQVGRGG